LAYLSSLRTSTSEEMSQCTGEKLHENEVVILIKHITVSAGNLQYM
jgi:hypothetical protein